LLCPGTLLSFLFANGRHLYVLPIVKGLLALVAILAQALLTLVRGHLVALLLFSVRHNC
jgi:hypothetical protein